MQDGGGWNRVKGVSLPNRPSSVEHWLVPPPRAHDRGNLRLLFFPYAGGGASAFRGWQSYFPGSIQVHAIQYPGRESRWGEPGCYTLYQLVSALGELLTASMDRCCALAGHSLGGMVAFELTRMLVRRGGPVPEHLFLSAVCAPQLKKPAMIHHLPEEQFLLEIRSYGGLPPEICRDREYVKLFLPILKNDLRLYEEHVFTPGTPLPVPVTVLGGLEDPKVSPRDLLAWAAHTQHPLTSRFFTGRHFFLFEHAAEISQIIQATLRHARRG
jgi:surfactin synthase thioesterase subunit